MENCRTCKFWKQTSNIEFAGAINVGECLGILNGDKINISLSLGWEGGYIDQIETDEDFGCILHKLDETEI